MNWWSRLLVSLLLVPPYLALFVANYWYFFDTAPPLRIVYQHPRFTSQPVTSRDDAEKLEVREAVGGSTVYAYREICVDREMPGIIRARWVSNDVIWSMQDRRFISSPAGCRSVSYAVTVPLAAGTRNLSYVTERDYAVNPMRTVVVVAPPLTLTVTGDK